MGWHGNFFVHVLAFSSLGLATSSFGLLMGCAVTDIKTAMEMAPAVLVPQILFCGFFIRIDQIPSFLRWLQYVCSLKWGINVIFINELEDDDSVGPKSGWAEVLDQNDVDPDMIFSTRLDALAPEGQGIVQLRSITSVGNMAINQGVAQRPTLGLRAIASGMPPQFSGWSESGLRLCPHFLPNGISKWQDLNRTLLAKDGKSRLLPETTCLACASQS
eukprot:6478083-Amphidinium_carterae.1